LAKSRSIGVFEPAILITPQGARKYRTKTLDKQVFCVIFLTGDNDFRVIGWVTKELGLNSRSAAYGGIR